MVERLPAHRRRRQLLDVALGVFAEQGFHVTSMEDVAGAAGITKPVLYRHFRSKRALYLELLDDVGQRVLAAVLAATAAAAGPRQQVEAGFTAYFTMVAAEPDAFRLLFGSGARRDEEFAGAVRQVERTLAEAVAGLIDADIDHDHRLLLAHGLVGLAEGTSRQWLAEALDLDPGVMARRLARLAWAGLRGVRR